MYKSVKNDLIIKVGDFGISHHLHSQSQRWYLCNVGGSVIYMAPEALMKQASDERIDIYALGVILLELIIGAHLFAEEIEDKHKWEQLIYHEKVTDIGPNRYKTRDWY